MKISTGIIIGLAMLIVSACAPSAITPPEEDHNPPGEGSSIEDMQAQSLAKIDREACAAKGGRVSQEGMMGLWRCVLPYGDANKLCSDTSDCEGKCLAVDATTDYQAAAGTAQGRCQASDSPFGCYAEIRNGTADPMLCVD